MKEEERRKKVGFICLEKKSGWQLRGSIDRHRQEGAGHGRKAVTGPCK
jgi:hypothetical protein